MPRRRKGASKPRPKTPHVALRLPSGPDGLYMRCDAIWTALKADKAHFPNPYPDASVVDQDLAAFATALQEAENGGPVEMAALYAAESKVRSTFGLLGKYVESEIRSLPIDDVPAILAGVLMSQSNVGQRPPKLDFTVQQATATSPVSLIARALPDAQMYIWEQQSADQPAWAPIGRGSKARFSIAGLPSGKVCSFRFYALLRDGTQSPYSQVLSILIK